MDPLGKCARMTEGATSEWWGSLRCRLDFCLLFESGERSQEAHTNFKLALPSRKVLNFCPSQLLSFKNWGYRQEPPQLCHLRNWRVTLDFRLQEATQALASLGDHSQPAPLPHQGSPFIKCFCRWMWMAAIAKCLAGVQGHAVGRGWLWVLCLSVRCVEETCLDSCIKYDSTKADCG